MNATRHDASATSGYRAPQDQPLGEYPALPAVCAGCLDEYHQYGGGTCRRCWKAAGGIGVEVTFTDVSDAALVSAALGLRYGTTMADLSDAIFRAHDEARRGYNAIIRLTDTARQTGLL